MNVQQCVTPLKGLILSKCFTGFISCPGFRNLSTLMEIGVSFSDLSDRDKQTDA